MILDIAPFVAREYTETLVHLFHDCEKSQDLWNLLCLWIKNKTHVSVEFNVQDIFFGVDDYILNFIIMVSKYYIYISAKNTPANSTPICGAYTHKFGAS